MSHPNPEAEQPRPGPQQGQQPGYGAGSQPSQEPHPARGPAQPLGSDQDNRILAILAHLSPIIALLLSAGWLSWLGPLVMWLVFRDRGPLVRNASATAFNFNLTVWIAIVVGWICLFTIVLIPVAILVWIGAGLLQLIFSIVGAVRANRGEVYRYPLQIPLLR